jgi:tetratricopeptide (TPR) repeat protein
MAKSRRIAAEPHVVNTPSQESLESQTTSAGLLTKAMGQRVATLMAAAALVYVAYWPHDSVEVQQGGARYLVLWMLINAIVALISFDLPSVRDLRIDLLAWCIPAWMVISLIAHHQTANLRLGLNECGWWIATAAAISISRRIAVQKQTAVAFLQLIIAISVGVAVYGWHQSLIGIPKMIADYEADPDAMLQQIGIAAEEGSAMRVVFENRLYDGGPTGTFALANSMAVMLLGGLIVSAAVATTTWKANTILRRSLLILATAIIGSMLLASRSRAAVLALALILGCYGVQRMLAALFVGKQQSRRLAMASTVALLVIIAGAFVSVILFRDSEWLAQAPASIAIRLNYWKACFGMLSDSPWFGVGPGQFKANYEAYRMAESNEQIADPHQFLLQIATAGGYPAMAFAMLIIISMTWNALKSAVVATELTPDNPPLTEPDQVEDENAASTVWLGSLLGMGIVWLIGAAIGLLPMLDAALISTVAAAIVATFLVYSETDTTNEKFGARAVAAYAVAAMAIALLSSGGITVPGVSLMAWMLAGITCPIATAPIESRTSSNPVATKRDWGSVGLAIIVGCSALAWYRLGITPVDRVNRLENQFEMHWSQGQIEPAIAALKEATEADPFHVQPWLQLVALDRTIAVAQPERRAFWEEQWREAEEQAIARAPRDPVVLKQLGDNWLIHFQRYGERTSLERALGIFSKAVERSPSHESYAAQLAAILHATGNVAAREMAAKAQALSQAGGYYERSLAFTPLIVPEQVGPEVAKEPRQRPAAEVLAPLLGTQK